MNTENEKTCACGHNHDNEAKAEGCTCGHNHDHEAKAEGCACGHNHDHEAHEEGCSCGHDHDHEAHEEGCSCGHDHAPRKRTGEPLNELQAAFMHHLQHTHYLPLARFILESDVESDFQIVSLAPVYLSSANDTMQQVKEMGALLLELERMGEITLDYDMPLNNYGYEEYENSTLYAYFCETVAAGAEKEGTLGNRPRLELGSIAIAE